MGCGWVGGCGGGRGWRGPVTMRLNAGDGLREALRTPSYLASSGCAHRAHGDNIQMLQDAGPLQAGPGQVRSLTLSWEFLVREAPSADARWEYSSNLALAFLARSSAARTHGGGSCHCWWRVRLGGETGRSGTTTVTTVTTVTTCPRAADDTDARAALHVTASSFSWSATGGTSGLATSRRGGRGCPVRRLATLPQAHSGTGLIGQAPTTPHRRPLHPSHGRHRPSAWQCLEGRLHPGGGGAPPLVAVGKPRVTINGSVVQVRHAGIFQEISVTARDISGVTMYLLTPWHVVSGISRLGKISGSNA